MQRWLFEARQGGELKSVLIYALYICRRVSLLLFEYNNFFSRDVRTLSRLGKFPTAMVATPRGFGSTTSSDVAAKQRAPSRTARGATRYVQGGIDGRPLHAAHYVTQNEKPQTNHIDGRPLHGRSYEFQ